jgi:hypothetical protein
MRTIALMPPTRTRACLTAAVLFGLLSVTDLLLTGWLLQRPEQSVYEANPLASGVLALWGWPGMVALKLAAVLLACGLGVFLFRRRPRAGLGVFVFGCVITGAVVLWSGCLALALETDPSNACSAEDRLLREETEAIWKKRATLAEYQRCIGRIADDLIGARCGLKEATERLAATERGQERGWLLALRDLYLTESDLECLAINVARQTVWMLGDRQADPAQVYEVSDRLAAEFQALFGRVLPLSDSPPGVPTEATETTETVLIETVP